MFRRSSTPSESKDSVGSLPFKANDGDQDGGTTSDPHSSTFAKGNKCSLFWYYSIYPGEARKLYFQNVLDNSLWKALLLVLTFILLFGAQIRDIFIPPDGDGACDAILMTTFGLLVIDMLMRIDSEPTYFLCICRSNDSLERTWFNYVQVGSFLFWCDILSTMTLLTEISFINKKGFAARSFFIQLDQFGIPVSTHLNGVMFATRTEVCTHTNHR
jgi:hypothetical protein